MKILWIVSSGWKEGGIENLLVVAKDALEHKGHTVRIFSSDTRPDMPHFSDYEFKTPSGIFRTLMYSFNPYAYRLLKKVITEYAPDVVHIHNIGHASPSILFALKKTPTILTIHGPEAFIKSLIVLCFPASDFKHGIRTKKDLCVKGTLRYMYHRYINGPLYFLGFRNIKTVTTPSHYMQELVANDGHPNIILPNGTLLFEYHPLTNEQLNNSIVYAGRLESYKGIDYLIRAFALVTKKFPESQLHIAGSGVIKNDLARLAEELSVAHSVNFLGHLERNELQNLYAQSVVVVMPSTWIEAFGLVGIEAMSVGRPVVASNVGGIPDWLIDGKTGYLVPPANAEAIADALIRLFEDKPLLLEMMKNSRVRAEEFSIDSYTNSLIALYQKSLK